MSYEVRSGLRKYIKHHELIFDNYRIALKYVLVELSELIGFSYDLSDTNNGLGCWRNGIYILWLSSSPRDNNSAERSMGPRPSCFCFVMRGTAYCLFLIIIRLKRSTLLQDT